jgi:hypothetical protein
MRLSLITARRRFLRLNSLREKAEREYFGNDLIFKSRDGMTQSDWD